MLLLYLLIGLGTTTAHSDYGVSFRAQNFDKTVRNIDKDAIIKHQREKRFVTGYFVPQNLTNTPTWGNMNITRNNTTFTRQSNNSRNFENIFLNNGTRPSSHVTVIYPGQPGYVEPLKNTTGFSLVRLGPYGNMTDVTGKYFNPWQTNNVNTTWPDNPNYITVRPGYNSNGNNTSNATGYIVPVNPATPGHTHYPGYPGYPAPNAVYPAPNASYPAPNNGYPAPNTVYPVPNTRYPAPTTGYPAQNTGYPATNINPGQNYNTSVARPVFPNHNNINVIPANKNNFSNSNPSGYNVQPVNPVAPGNRPYYPVPNVGYPASNMSNLAPNTSYPAPNTGYPRPNTGYPAPNTWYPAPNSVYPAPNTGYPAPNTGFPASSVYNNNGNSFNTTASLENCKCKLPRANSTITKEERTMDACMIACNNCPEGMKMSSFGICVKDLDYDE